MDKAQLLELLDVGPVIASVKDEAGLSAALKSDVGVIFLLFGDVLNIGEMVGRAHAAGKAVFVHLDLVDGLAAREVSVDFIARNTAADGVLSTKASLTRRAHHRQGGCHRGPGGRRGGRVHHQSCGMGHVRPPSRIFSKIVYPFQRKGEWNEPRPQEGAGLVPLFF